MSDTPKAVSEELEVIQAGTPSPLEIELDSKKVESRIGAIARSIDGAVKVSIQRTNTQDWVKMTGKNGKTSYYLQATGAQKVRSIWGIYFADRNVTKELNPDGSFSYIVEGTVGSSVLDNLYGQKITIQIDGGRSSSDEFFTGRNRTVDPMDVRKAAVSNWEARAICSLLGLKNMTEADLIKNGIDVKAVQGFAFNKGAEGGDQHSGTDKAIISEAQAKRLFAICKESNVPHEKVKAYIFAKFKYTSSSQIEKKNYEAICKWVQDGGPSDDDAADRDPGADG